MVAAVSSQLTALLVQSKATDQQEYPERTDTSHTNGHNDGTCATASRDDSSDVQIFQVLIVEDDTMQQIVLKELFSSANKASTVSHAMPRIKHCSYKHPHT